MGHHAPHAADESRTPTACDVTMLRFSRPRRAVLGDPALQLVEISGNANRNTTMHAILVARLSM